MRRGSGGKVICNKVEIKLKTEINKLMKKVDHSPKKTAYFVDAPTGGS